MRTCACSCPTTTRSAMEQAMNLEEAKREARSILGLSKSGPLGKYKDAMAKEMAGLTVSVQDSTRFHSSWRSNR